MHFSSGFVLGHFPIVFSHLVSSQIANKRCSMKHAEVAIARQAVEEGRALVVIVNKMDLLRGRQNMALHDKIIDAVPREIQAVIPQVCATSIGLDVIQNF